MGRWLGGVRKASKREEVRRKEVKVETKALMTFWKSSKGACDGCWHGL